MSEKHTCPYCGKEMQKKCYINTETGEVVSRFYECPHCNLKM